MKRIPSILALALPLFTACGSEGGDAASPHSESASSAEAPRSLMLVTIDTLRADRLGCYGYEQASSPTIDGLAANGVRFEHSTSAAPLTFPSHTSIMTGTIPPQHGARDNASHRALPELLTMAEVFQGAGFQTGAFIAAFVLDSIYGLDQGFDVYADTPQLQEKPTAEFEERPARDVNVDAMAWLKTLDPERPFFMWVHYFEPHLPYPAKDLLPKGFRNRPYDGEIHVVDGELGKLLDNLDALGLREETLVVLTSDHGESFGEHDEATHGYFAYEATLRVPLIMQHASLKTGSVVTERVSSTHIFPTVLEIFDLSPGDLPPLGGSLVSLMNGETGSPRTVYFESMTPRLNYGWAPIQGITVDDMKYIRVPRAELYSLSDDPNELVNLHDSDPETAKRLAAALDAVLREHDNPLRSESARRELTANEREKLANLGYTGTASATTPELTLHDPKDGVERIAMEDEVRHHLEHAEYDDAERKLKKLLREDSRNPIFNAHYGLLMMKRKQHRGAIDFLRKAIAGGQDNATVYCNLGTCQNFTGELQKAKGNLESALKQNPKHLLSLFWMGDTCTKLGEKEEAIAAYETLLKHWDGGEGPTTQQMTGLIEKLKR